MSWMYLRIPDIHGAKFQWNLLILDVSKIWLILFGQCFIDGKSGLKVRKRHLVVELKLKMSLFADLTFSISALPPGGIFPLWLHFFHLCTLIRKSYSNVHPPATMSFLHFLARLEGNYNIWILSDMEPVWFCLHCPGWIISNYKKTRYHRFYCYSLVVMVSAHNFTTLWWTLEKFLNQAMQRVNDKITVWL